MNKNRTRDLTVVSLGEVRMLLRIKKAWAWMCRFPKRITGFYTPLGGLSWTDDKIPEIENSQSSDLAGTVEKERRRVSCAYCSGSGQDPNMLGPCRICSGSGELILDFDNPVTCRYCSGSAQDPNMLGPCRVCKGLGWRRRVSSE